MLNARFCHSTLFNSIGTEKFRQAPLLRVLLGLPLLGNGWPAGQVMVLGSEFRNSALWRPADIPAGCGRDRGTQRMLAPWASLPQGVGALASGAKKAPNSVPDDAVESLETI